MALVRQDNNRTADVYQDRYVPYSTGSDSIGDYVADSNGLPVYNPATVRVPDSQAASSQADQFATPMGIGMPGSGYYNVSNAYYQATNENDNLAGLANYFNGLFSSVGYENAQNRAFNSAQAALQREWSSRENELARDFNERMSNTAYQRTVADLRAAGLNPILAVSQGGSSAAAAPVGTGSAASNQTGGGDTISDILNALANVASSVSGFYPSKSISYVLRGKVK